MLLRFGVANHLSIKEPQALSLTATSLKDVEGGLIDCPAAPEGKVLPAVVIYGANAAGKSNLIAALRFMRSAVLFSHSRGEPGSTIPRKPFALDPACTEKPSVFDADFIVDGVRYHYGFEASEKVFNDEWLYSFPNNRRQSLFERCHDEFKFGRELKGRNRVIADLTRPNSLFLSAAAQNDHEQLSKVANFFRALQSDLQTSVEGHTAARNLAGNDIDKRIINLLHEIGTGVVDYRRVEQEVPEEIRTLGRELAIAIRKLRKETTDIDPQTDSTRAIIQLAHKGHDGAEIFFDLDSESAGTRRLLPLLGRAFRVLDTGAPLLIDELDASLHTQACEAVLALFSSSDTNEHGAQLIATTHDTNLLRSPLLRRDQVWFTEKDAEGATHLYPLTDIRTRRGDNLEKGYLQGRFGAIPFSGNIVDLVAAV